jgi:hypothetical protein
VICALTVSRRKKWVEKPVFSYVLRTPIKVQLYPPTSSLLLNVSFHHYTTIQQNRARQTFLLRGQDLSYLLHSLHQRHGSMKIPPLFNGIEGVKPSSCAARTFPIYFTSSSTSKQRKDVHANVNAISSPTPSPTQRQRQRRSCWPMGRWTKRRRPTRARRRATGQMRSTTMAIKALIDAVVKLDRENQTRPYASWSTAQPSNPLQHWIWRHTIRSRSVTSEQLPCTQIVNTLSSYWSLVGMDCQKGPARPAVF